MNTLLRKIFSYAKKLCGNLINYCGYEVHKIGSLNGFWNHDTSFVQAYKDIQNNTVVSIDRCYILYQSIKAVRHIPGDIAELGVYKGGTAYIILKAFETLEDSKANINKKLFLFDTFEGLPEHATLSSHEKNNIKNHDDFSKNSLESVKKLLYTSFDQKKNDIIFKQGFFPQSAQNLESQNFSLVYLDGDLYQSMIDGLNFFYPKMSRGGIIIIDDYQSDCWPGTTKAVHEFSAQHSLSPIMTQRNQCIILC